MSEIAAVVLAAGRGKRMRSATPKVLHAIGGRPLIAFPLALARRLGCERIVTVVGHGRKEVERVVAGLPGGEDVSLAVQEEQLGTGHAVMAALPALRGFREAVLILSGDVPLLGRETISRLRRAYRRAGGPLAMVAFRPDDPSGYGRVIREGRGAVAVREHRDCNRAERAIGEVNAGIYLVDIGFLRRSVRRLRADNDQGELYLTDLVELAARGSRVPVIEADESEVAGVNDRVDLARAERELLARKKEELMRGGVTLRHPESVWIDLDVEVGRDTEIEPGVRLLGATRIGARCRVESGCIVSESRVAAGASLLAYSLLDGAEVGPGAQVGPLARLRPGAVLRSGAKVGNFVEVKKTVIGAGSKANHLAYLGDGEIGEGVNVGAGTIFCNYDGFSKHKTVLEDGVFIGSDSQLVAPVTVGEGAYVASGSTVTRDVPPDALAIARGRQQNRERAAAVLRRTLAARKRKADREQSGQGGGKGKKR